MKRCLLSIGVLFGAFPFLQVSAQTMGIYIASGTTMQIAKGVLVYNGGSMDLQGTVTNAGNVMVVGGSSDTFTTANAGSFTNVLNEPANYASAPLTGPNDAITPPFTYGQLYISGIPQSNLTGAITEQLTTSNQGAYQQMGIPFYNKTISELSAEFGRAAFPFNNTRYSQSEVLTYNNKDVRSDNADINNPTAKQGVYYMLGTGRSTMDLTQLRSVKGIPYSDVGSDNTALLKDAGLNVIFGTNGNNINLYNERYNSYLFDEFAPTGTEWTGNFGKNIYQFSNPYFTNLDLSDMGTQISNLQGIRLSVGTVTYTPGVGSALVASTEKKVTWNSAANSFAGDVEYLTIRPFGAFEIKLLDNTGSKTINFGDYRRFAYYHGTATPPLSNPTQASVGSVPAQPTIKSKSITTGSGTLKQLGVIGLDAYGQEVSRTYYVVSPSAQTGFSSDVRLEVMSNDDNGFGTYEEAKSGGYDYSKTKHMLYINEANENDFFGKNLMLLNYNPRIVSVKFEIRENAKLLSDGQSSLSTGQDFYYKIGDKTPQAVSQGLTSAFSGQVNGAEMQLYYGYPEEKSLGLDEGALNVKTQVVYEPTQRQYVVKFSPTWKSAEVSVYDLSGRLVQFAKNVKTNQNFNINVRKDQPAGYVVRIVSAEGQVVTSKIVTR